MRGGAELATWLGMNRLPIVSVAADASGRHVFSGQLAPLIGGQVRVWDAFSRGAATALDGAQDTNDPIAFSPNGRTIVFSPDGRSLVSGSEGGIVRIYDVDSRTNANGLLGTCCSRENPRIRSERYETDVRFG